MEIKMPMQIKSIKYSYALGLVVELCLLLMIILQSKVYLGSESFVMIIFALALLLLLWPELKVTPGSVASFRDRLLSLAVYIGCAGVLLGFFAGAHLSFSIAIYVLVFQLGIIVFIRIRRFSKE
jgi:predicted membrane channel-forming protein YqfA (hemolysin III family)